ncbi:hypothetical protein [Clostridium hydrogenum]|uniref:hypothetical protein n=1 Tax=Clostridium hydrogenum TaxID=2855764 RepID=UPI001F40B725|nr:hypothetical protein [Clostridium hydrogenum]
MDENNIFVRISYKANEGKGNTETNKNEHNFIETKTTVRNFSTEAKKYLIGGGVYNRHGGKVFFSAKSLKEVNDVTSCEKGFVKNSFVKYDIFIMPKALIGR